MDQHPPEARLKVLESATQRLDERVTAHGREIDELSHAVTEIRTNDRHRDESLRRIQASIDAHGGKLDAMRQDMLAATTGKSAAKWEQAIWIVISALIAFAMLRMGIAG